MTAVRRLYLGSVVFMVFMAGGFAAGAGERDKVDELTSESPLILGKASGKMPHEKVYCGQNVYPLSLIHI